MKLVIYGAKALALGIYTAIRELYPEYPIMCFLVESLRNNPAVLAGLQVRQIEEFSGTVGENQKNDIHILIGTPEDIHPEIVRILGQYGFCHYTCMDSRKESTLMEQYFTKRQIFPSIHKLPIGNEKAKIQVFMAKFYKDRKLENIHVFPYWFHPIQAGAELTNVRVADDTDNTGRHISYKNVNYCELTVLYWIWKNLLSVVPVKEEYYGLFHYRRILDITATDLYRLKKSDIDVILQFPTLHEPDIREHHARYMKENDWEAMLTALRELQPEYAKAFPEILAQSYFYNYNLIIAKQEVLAAYCEWLFPILERTEELSQPRGNERADRYIGYLGENLMTLYFIHNRKKLKVVHAGRLMLT